MICLQKEKIENTLQYFVKSAERKNLKITQRDMAKKLGISRNTIQRLEKRAKEELYGK